MGLGLGLGFGLGFGFGFGFGLLLSSTKLLLISSVMSTLLFELTAQVSATWLAGGRIGIRDRVRGSGYGLGVRGYGQGWE